MSVSARVRRRPRTSPGTKQQYGLEAERESQLVTRPRQANQTATRAHARVAARNPAVNYLACASRTPRDAEECNRSIASVLLVACWPACLPAACLLPACCLLAAARVRSLQRRETGSASRRSTDDEPLTRRSMSRPRQQFRGGRRPGGMPALVARENRPRARPESSFTPGALIVWAALVFVVAL